jgi:hypothetical protein
MPGKPQMPAGQHTVPCKHNKGWCWAQPSLSLPAQKVALGASTIYQPCQPLHTLVCGGILQTLCCCCLEGHVSAGKPAVAALTASIAHVAAGAHLTHLPHALHGWPPPLGVMHFMGPHAPCCYRHLCWHAKLKLQQ